MDDTQTLATRLVFASDARHRLYKGLKVAAAAVGCTLGPRGRTVIIQRPDQAPLVTKDGVTVAKAIRLRDPVERMGAQLVCEAAGQTNEVAGDGTTTATVLTEALVAEGLKLLDAGFSSRAVCKALETTVSVVDEALKANARPVTTREEIAQVGTISANGDRIIGDLIADAMDKVGRDGIIAVEDAKGMATTLEVVEGMQFDRGYVSPYFVNDNERMRASYADALVLVTDKKLTGFKDIVPVLEAAARNQRPLLIVADDFEGEAMTGLVLNRVKTNMAVVAVKAPGYGQTRADMLRDVCVLTGATLVSSATGQSFDKFDVGVLGKVKKVVVDARSTTLVGTGGMEEAIDRHVAELKNQLDDVTLSAEATQLLRSRVAKLSAGCAVIKVGGSTELEMVERKFRIEDALNATKAAADEGIVPGGGAALYHAARDARLRATFSSSALLPEEGTVFDAVLRACEAPLRRIVSNSGKSADVVVADLDRHAPDLTRSFGYNAATDEYGDMVVQGVVDPVKVTRSALKHAASVAVTFLTLDAVVYDDKDEPKA